MDMPLEAASAVLIKMREERNKLIESVKRKHWRESEKACTIADYEQQKAALEIAISALRARALEIKEASNG